MIAPEVSDLIVDYDPDTLARRDVPAADVLAALADAKAPRAAFRVVHALDTEAGVLCRAAVDGASFDRTSSSSGSTRSFASQA